MNKKRAQEYRKLRAEELRRFGEILNEEGLIRDAGPVQAAASMCAVPCTIDNVECWEYDLTDLEFNDADDHSLRHVRPEGIIGLQLELSVSLLGFCLDNYSKDDPFKRLNVDILSKGKDKGGNGFICAWHLDKHKRDPGDNPSVLAHPEYHFQHGGKRIWGLNNYGSNLLLETPRLAHPPMDAILAIDFILSNYLGRKWAVLHSENSFYKALVRSAQQRCWAPYALSTATISNLITTQSSWEAKSIWPQLVLADTSPAMSTT